ncbi:MAG: FtsX-like permease family protein [Clostridiaceae bacterium]|nr:FtsX-like permease family protein [Clostridiaceae bacterium]
MFWRNFRRDTLYTATRLISVIIITLVAVMLYVGFADLSYNVDLITSQYYEKQNAADYWITGQNLTKNDCTKLLKIEGVEEVQPRVMFTAENRYNSDITLLIYAVPGEININIPKLLEGKLPEANNEMMLGKVFADAQGLQVGDRYEMKIPGTDQFLKMTICALVQDPECIYNIDSKSLMPNPSRHGFAYIPEEAVSAVFGKNVYNQICITTTETHDENEIRSGVNDALGTRVINVVALKDNMNAYNILSISNSIKTIILVFPLIFFAIAALIMFSTMSRLVENARLSIGTFKALGYDDSKITLYYLMYAVLVVNIGFLLGLLPTKLFTLFIIRTIYGLQDLPSFQLVHDKFAIFTAYAATCAICLGTAFVVTRRELKEMPSACMRPKAQKEAGKNFLERMPLLWNRFGFTQKYIARNIFRKKMRMAICIIGISSCMALIMTAMGIMDSINNYLNILDDKAQKFDLLVTLDSTVTENQYKHIENINGVTEVQAEMATGVKLYASSSQYTSYVTITDDVISLKLIDAYGPSVTMLPSDGVILDKKIADSLGVSVDDTIKAKFYGDNKYYDLRVSSIIKGIKGAYVGRTFWRSIGKGFTPTTLYLKTDDPDVLAKRLNGFDFIENIQDKSSAMKASRNSVMSIVSIVAILIVFGGLLAFVVLYNLGVVSFFEQIRSLATLMVLGFYDGEIKQLVLTENIVFAVIGVLLGAAPGFILTGMILSSIDMMSIQTFVKPLSYLISGALTLVFALLVNLMLGRQMGKIDMLGALKSVE